MDTYLSTTLEQLRSNKYSDLNIVLGNESCDLDSAVSALAYGAFLHWQYLQIKCKVCTRVHRDESRDELFVPIMNVDREDFDLKTEVAFCLREHGIDETKLVFRDDYDLKELVTKNNTSITLVDHHILAKRDRFLTPYVTEIIDHRPIDKTDWRYKDTTRSTIEIVGSCSTLVAQRIKHLGTLIAKDVDFFDTYPICTDILHSAIILDTVNFSKEVNKGTPHDEEIMLFLESLIQPENCVEERKCKLERLVEARKDVTTLTPAQLLRKDVKIEADVLVPSFPILVEEFLQKPGASQAVAEALARRDCTLAVLLGMSFVGELRRDAALCPVGNKAAQLAKYLQDCISPPLQLSKQDIPKSDCIYFKQLNLSASRKQYMPVVKEFLRSTTPE